MYSKNRMLIRILTIATISSIFLLILLLSLTAPSSAGPVVILFAFILFYLSLLGIVTFLLYTGAHFIYFLVQLFTNRIIRTKLSIRRAYLYATVIATLPMMAVGLYSVGGVKWYELILIALFGLIGIVYIARRT